MSKIGEKPLIDTLIGNLSEDELTALKQAINQGNITSYKSGLDLYTNGKLGLVHIPDYNGVYLNHYLLAFSKNTQDLTIYQVLSNGDLKRVNEYLDINELRRVIDDAMIEAGAIVPENVKFTVNNIKNLTDAECNDLKVGDMVAKKTGDQYHVYVVTYKEPGQGMCLTYTDASVVETQSYDYTAGHWVYNSEDKTELGNFDPSTLYGKFVRIMNAPSSTTLTDEEYNQIKEGVFINGEFVNLINPIIFPFADKNRGLIIGKTKNSYDFEFKMYYVSSDTKEFTIEATMIKASLHTGKAKILIDQINNKSYPEYPSNASIGQFICRKGVLQYYIPVAQDNITSGDTIALDSALGKALLDHLDVEINGFRARYEYTSGNYVVYSSKSEVDSGLKLQVNMISYNTTNGELSFNQMTFTPDN